MNLLKKYLNVHGLSSVQSAYLYAIFYLPFLPRKVLNIIIY